MFYFDVDFLSSVLSCGISHVWMRVALSSHNFIDVVKQGSGEAEMAQDVRPFCQKELLEVVNILGQAVRRIEAYRVQTCNLGNTSV